MARRNVMENFKGKKKKKKKKKRGRSSPITVLATTVNIKIGYALRWVSFLTELVFG